MSAFSNFEFLVGSLFKASRIRDLSSFKLWLIRALRLFSMIGLVALRCSEADLLAGFLGISMLKQAMGEDMMSSSEELKKKLFSLQVFGD